MIYSVQTFPYVTILSPQMQLKNQNKIKLWIQVCSAQTLFTEHIFHQSANPFMLLICGSKPPISKYSK